MLIKSDGSMEYNVTKKTMKVIVKTILLLFLIISTCSCISVEQIGKVNMISNRNVSTKENYARLTTYSGGTFQELKNSESTSIEDAVDHAKIYVVHHRHANFFAVVGDVYGLANENGEGIREFRGFRVGDRVYWGGNSNTKTGIIKALIDDEDCLIETDDGTLIKQEYEDIYK